MLVKQFPTAQNYLHLLGLMASRIEQRKTFYETNSVTSTPFLETSNNGSKNNSSIQQSYTRTSPFWLKEENLLLGKTFCTQKSSKVVTTDASKYGYGGHFENQLFQGTWSMQEAKMHINWLELKAYT